MNSHHMKEVHIKFCVINMSSNLCYSVMNRWWLIFLATKGETGNSKRKHNKTTQHDVQYNSKTFQCEIAFIQQFDKLLFGLVESNKERWWFVGLFHLFASFNTNCSSNEPDRPLNLVLLWKSSTSRSFSLRFSLVVAVAADFFLILVSFGFPC